MEKERTKELLYLDIMKILEANASGDFEKIEHGFNQIRKYILNKEKLFVDGTNKDEEKYFEDIKVVQNEWKKRAEKALESNNTEECIVLSQQNNMQLEQDIQRLSIEYKDKAIESIKSYYDRL